MAKMWLLIGLLFLASGGCTRRDWVDDMLVLTDVSGTWSGTVVWSGNPNLSLRLGQSGSRVTGDASWGAAGNMPALSGPIQGVVNGEVFSFSIDGPRD